MARGERHAGGDGAAAQSGGGRSIASLEDPIEVMHRDKMASVNQRELGTDTRDWATALKAAMRQDPDVILIGEMRDAETVKAALAAAETGHFVMSTLHTTDAKETVNRVIDFFPPFEQKQVRLGLATSLRGIVCQRLMPRADEQGRAVVMEIAVNSPRLAEAIADPDRTDMIEDIIADGAYSGMQTFDQHLLRLVLDGTVTIRAAKLASSNTHDFSVMLKRAGVDPVLVGRHDFSAFGGGERQPIRTLHRVRVRRRGAQVTIEVPPLASTIQTLPSLSLTVSSSPSVNPFSCPFALKAIAR